MPKPIFTQADIAAWYREMEVNPPSPTEAEWPSFGDITTFRGGALTAGAVLRLQTRDNRFVDIRMNPAVAREIAHWLLHAGQQAGWLDERYSVISPVADFDA